MKTEKSFSARHREAMRAKRVHERAEKEFRRAQLEHQSKLKALTDLVRPPWLLAVEAYNKGNPDFCIVEDEFYPSFGKYGRPTFLFLQFLLRGKNGEPNEELEALDVERIERRLKRLLNPRLKAANLPLTLKEIRVPSRYYIR